MGIGYNRQDWYKRKRYSWFVEPILDNHIRNYIDANGMKGEEYYALRSDHAFTDKFADAIHQKVGVGPHDMRGEEFKIGDKLLIGYSNHISIGTVVSIKDVAAGKATYGSTDCYQIKISVAEDTNKNRIGKKATARRPERMLKM